MKFLMGILIVATIGLGYEAEVTNSVLLGGGAVLSGVGAFLCGYAGITERSRA